MQIAQLRLTAQLSDRGSLVWPGDYGLTVAAKICELGPLTALPQLSWILRYVTSGSGGSGGRWVRTNMGPAARISERGPGPHATRRAPHTA